MSAKSPVTILTEILSIFKQPSATYVFENLGSRVQKFSCTLKVMNKTVIGYGLSKKMAKTAAAKIMLKKLKYRKRFESDICENYVGLLNSFALKHKMQPPVYENAHCVEQGKYVTICRLHNWVGCGESINKKEAKQQSARNLIESIKLQPSKEVKEKALSE